MHQKTKKGNKRFRHAVAIAAALAFVALLPTAAGFVLHDTAITRSSPTAPQWLFDTPIAHRGLHSDSADENSLAAFEAAAQRGYAIELDIHLTADGVPVVAHDGNLKRVCGVSASISKLTLSELQQFTLNITNEPVPTLEQALQLINGRVPVLVDIKNYLSIGKLEDAVILCLRNYSGEFAVQSFNPFVCRYLNSAAPEFCVGLLLNDIPVLCDNTYSRRAKDCCFTRIFSPEFVVYRYSLVKPAMLDDYRARGTAVLGYGADETQLAARDYLSCVDNLIFDQAEL